MKQVYVTKRSSYSGEPSGAYMSFAKAEKAAEAFGQSALSIVAVPLLDTPDGRFTIDLDALDDDGVDPMAKEVPDAV